jgi:hypothetical protein
MIESGALARPLGRAPNRNSFIESSLMVGLMPRYRGRSLKISLAVLESEHPSDVNVSDGSDKRSH